MKKLMAITLGMFMAGAVLACPIKNDEQLVCEALVCAVGIAIPESHAECVKVQTKFAIYLATLAPWDDPPKCKNRDMNCNAVGNASNNIPPNSCGTLSGQERINCELQMAKYEGVSPTAKCESMTDPNQKAACFGRADDYSTR